MSSKSKGARAIARRRLGPVLTCGTAAVLLLATLFPVLWLVQMSFKTDVEAMRVPPTVFFVPTLDNYAAVFQGKFARSFVNSLVVSVLTTLTSMLLGVPAAYALSRASFGRSRSLALWVLSTRMAPPIAFAIPFFLTYRWLGLIDTVLGLLVIYLTFNLSLVMWMMRTFFDGIPRSLEEAAAIDGAGPLQAFARVTLPLSGPGLATIVNFMNYEGWEWGRIGAAATMIMLPVVAFALAVRRYLIRGLTAGALKG